MNAYRLMDVDEAIEKLLELKKRNKKAKVVICTVDFDNNFEYKFVASPDEGCSLVRKSETIIMNEDMYIPHMQLFSKKQSNIENIQKEGVLHDIFI